MRDEPMWRRYLRFFGANPEADVDDELRFHLEEKTSQLMQQGLSRAEARAEAVRQFGDLKEFRRMCRQQRVQRENRMDRREYFAGWMQDLRYAARRLKSDVGFTAVAVLILALGIAASTTVFTIVHALVIRPLPFQEPERLVWIANAGKGRDASDPSSITSRIGTLMSWRETTTSFERLAGYNAFFGYFTYNFSRPGGTPERLNGMGVTDSFFETLGVQPVLGRLFTPEEYVANGRRAVLLSDGLWRRLFAADPAVIGTTVSINDAPVLVAGVMPDWFDFASTFTPGSKVDMWEPFPMNATIDRNYGNVLAIVGRLKPGVSLTAAQAEINQATKTIKQLHPERGSTYQGSLTSLREHVSGQVRTPLAVMSAAVGLLLLLMCVNLANLMLARTLSRQREMSVRVALGAGRLRVARQLLTESLMLSAAGILLSIPLAVGATAVVARLQGSRVPLLSQVEVNLWALLFSALVGLLSGVLFGLAPALSLFHGSLFETLKQAGRGTDGNNRQWTRKGLVATEVALASVLLIGAGLLMRSFVKLMEADRGFQSEHVLAVRVDPGGRYPAPEKLDAFFLGVREKIAAAPGIDAVGLTDALPFDRDRSWNLGVIGKNYGPGEMPGGFVRMVSPGYFEAMRIPLIAGRLFNGGDVRGREPVIILNQSLARTLFGKGDAVGQMIAIGPPAGTRVVGVVKDVRHTSLEEEAGGEFYLVSNQRSPTSLDVVVRTSLPPATASAAIRQAVWSVDPTQPLGEFRLMDDLVARAASPRRFLLLLLGAFAGLALILASLGIYGVISYGVSQRGIEIGIRMALGAQPSHVQWNVLREALALTAAGLLVGVSGALVLTRLFATLLYEVKPADAATYGGITGLLLAVSALAGYLPSRRAARIDPVVALRAD